MQKEKSKILMIGFQRSGTTLLRRIISFHPEMNYCFHEAWILNKENLRLPISPFGEKIAWYKNIDKTMEYIEKWLNMFSNQSKIIHIIRNMEDVILSNYKFRKFEKEITKTLYKNSLSLLRNHFKNNPNYIEVDFETLVTYQFETITEIFKFCNLDYSAEIVNNVISPGKDKWRYFNNINKDRAYAYRNGEKE